MVPPPLLRKLDQSPAMLNPSTLPSKHSPAETPPHTPLGRCGKKRGAQALPPTHPPQGAQGPKCLEKKKGGGEFRPRGATALTSGLHSACPRTCQGWAQPQVQGCFPRPLSPGTPPKAGSRPASPLSLSSSASLRPQRLLALPTTPSRMHRESEKKKKLLQKIRDAPRRPGASQAPHACHGHPASPSILPACPVLWVPQSGAQFPLGCVCFGGGR